MHALALVLTLAGAATASADSAVVTCWQDATRQAQHFSVAAGYAVDRGMLLLNGVIVGGFSHCMRGSPATDPSDKENLIRCRRGEEWSSFSVLEGYSVDRGHLIRGGRPVDGFSECLKGVEAAAAATLRCLNDATGQAQSFGSEQGWRTDAGGQLLDSGGRPVAGYSRCLAAAQAQALESGQTISCLDMMSNQWKAFSKAQGYSTDRGALIHGGKPVGNYWQCVQGQPDAQRADQKDAIIVCRAPNGSVTVPAENHQLDASGRLLDLKGQVISGFSGCLRGYKASSDVTSGPSAPARALSERLAPRLTEGLGGLIRDAASFQKR